MKKYLLITLLFALSSSIASAQETEIQFGEDTSSLSVPVKKYINRHMLGIKYSYNFSGASFSPDISPKYINTPVNISLLYTYYHDLWDLMPYFGLQCGVKYGTEGFDSDWGYKEKYDIIEFPLISQFNFKSGPIRLLLNAGTYYAYRLNTYKETGWDKYDIRHDYGFIFGAGLGFIFGPIELHMEANVKRAVSSMYQPLKLSDEYWIFGYSQQLMISAGLFYNLF